MDDGAKAIEEAEHELRAHEHQMKIQRDANRLIEANQNVDRNKLLAVLMTAATMTIESLHGIRVSPDKMLEGPAAQFFSRVITTPEGAQEIGSLFEFVGSLASCVSYGKHPGMARAGGEGIPDGTKPIVWRFDDYKP